MMRNVEKFSAIFFIFCPSMRKTLYEKNGKKYTPKLRFFKISLQKNPSIRIFFQRKRNLGSCAIFIEKNGNYIVSRF